MRSVDSHIDHEHDVHFETSISPVSLGWPDRGCFPNGQWSKGHVTTCLGDFFGDWAAAHVAMSEDELLPLCLEANQSIQQCMRKMYASDIWLCKADARQIADDGLGFLKLYNTLATKSLRAGRALFSHMPKGHACEHNFFALKLSAMEHDWSLNPLMTSVEIDEDYIGKTSRLARRTSPLQVVKRVLQRTLQASYRHWQDAGFIKT